MRLYTNAVLIASKAFVAAPSPATTPFRIGLESVGKGAFSGSLDEIAMYDHALDEARIRAHFSASGR